jgi:hypothetical protein
MKPNEGCHLRLCNNGKKRCGSVLAAALPKLALFGSAVVSDLGPECTPKRTSIDRSEFMIVWRKYRPPRFSTKHMKSFAAKVAIGIALTKQPANRWLGQSITSDWRRISSDSNKNIDGLCDEVFDLVVACSSFG